MSQSFSGQSMGREAAMVALPFLCQSTMTLHFYDGLGFLHKDSQMWSSSFPPLQAVSPQPTSILSMSLLSKPLRHHQAPICTSGNTSQAGACRAMAQTICVCLTLFCLPQTSFYALLQASEEPLLSQIICGWEGFLSQMWESLLSFNSPQGPDPLPLLLFFIPSLCCPLQLCGNFLVLSDVQRPLLLFSTCFVRIVSFVDAFLIYLWGEISSMLSYFSAILTSSKISL